MNYYREILNALEKEQKLFAVLIDPDKITINHIADFIIKVNNSIATHIFVGGSIVNANITDAIVQEIKKHTRLPIVLFPGDITQISEHADALLFLSLISGRNPDYLIGKHIESVSKLRESNLEIIPTGYILIDGEKQSAIEKVTQTKPMPRNHIQMISDVAKAGEYLGMQFIYLEAGSGASQPITNEIINFVKQELRVPLIVGGGIQTTQQIQNAYDSGADMVVIGTAFEKDESFFDELKK